MGQSKVDNYYRMGNGYRQTTAEEHSCDTTIFGDMAGVDSYSINQHRGSNENAYEVQRSDRNINSQNGIHQSNNQQQQQRTTAIIRTSSRAYMDMLEQQQNSTIPSSSAAWNDTYNSEQLVQCSKQNNQSIQQRINSNNNNMQTTAPSSINTISTLANMSQYYQPSLTAPTSTSSMFDLLMMEKKVKTTGPIHNAKYKIKLCDKYMIDGKCPYKEKCQFAHGQEELMMWAERRRALIIQQSGPFTFSSSTVTTLQQQQQQQVSSATQNNVQLNTLYNGVPSTTHLHLNHPYQSSIHGDANYHFNQNEMRKTAPYHHPYATTATAPVGDQEENVASTSMYTPSSNNNLGTTGSSSLYHHGQELNMVNESSLSLSSATCIENDPLIKSIVDLLESGDLGCEDNVLDCASRERLLSADISKDVSFISPSLRPSSSLSNAATTISPFANPQGNAHEVLSPSKDISINDKSESFRSPFRSQNHSMRVNYAAFQRGSM